MAIPMTAQQEADLSDPNTPKSVFWCLLFQPDEGDIAVVNSNADVSYDSRTYQAALDEWEIEGQLNTGQALVAETITFSLDAGLQYEDGSNWVKDLLASTYHFRPFRLDMVINNALNGNFIIAPRTYHGFIDNIDTADAYGGESSIIVSCETGTFRAVDRNPTMCSDRDQRKRNANDSFFQNIATIGGTQVPFGVSNSNTPGAGGTQGGGGGSDGWDNFRRWTQ